MERDPAQVKDLKDIRIAHLELDRNAQKIKLPHRILGFQGKEGDALLPHYFVQISPWGINPLTPDVIPAVEHIIQDLDAEMGHADFIYVRKTHSETDIYLLLVLHHGVYFTANVAGGLFDIQQNFISQS